VKVFPTLLATVLASFSLPLQGQVWEFPPGTAVAREILERRWMPGAVVEAPPIFATGTFELRRPAAEDPFTKYLERLMKRRFPDAWRWPPIPLELSLHPHESCAADYLTSEYREAVQQFDDLRFQFLVEDEPEDGFR
jgi:hypothetical protein